MSGYAPGLSTVHTGPLPPSAKLHYYQNGTLSGVRCHRSRHKLLSEHAPGGRRGTIQGFSRQARLRLLKELAKLDQKIIPYPYLLLLLILIPFLLLPKLGKLI